MVAGRNLMNTCAVGFSGVLFGLKVILTHNSPGWGSVAGFSVPVKYLAWAELVFIQFITPNASFLGHACGILAGLLHLYVFKALLYKIRMQRRRSYRY
jgi:rhomboid domain-containing protein 1